MKEEGERGSRLPRGGSRGSANVGLRRPVPSSLPPFLKQGRFSAEAQKRPPRSQETAEENVSKTLLCHPHP